MASKITVTCTRIDGHVNTARHIVTWESWNTNHDMWTVSWKPCMTCEPWHVNRDTILNPQIWSHFYTQAAPNHLQLWSSPYIYNIYIYIHLCQVVQDSHPTSAMNKTNMYNFLDPRNHCINQWFCCIYVYRTEKRDSWHWQFDNRQCLLGSSEIRSRHQIRSQCHITGWRRRSPTEASAEKAQNRLDWGWRKIGGRATLSVVDWSHSLHSIRSHHTSLGRFQAGNSGQGLLQKLCSGGLVNLCPMQDMQDIHDSSFYYSHFQQSECHTASKSIRGLLFYNVNQYYNVTQYSSLKTDSKLQGWGVFRLTIRPWTLWLEKISYSYRKR